MIPNKCLLSPPEDLHSLTRPNSTQIYPDFSPWTHTQLEDKILISSVSRGYYNSAKVNFESISARSSLQESLSAISEGLADRFTEIVHIREEEINKISGISKRDGKVRFDILCGPGFSLPTRVTLTDHRRELWLQEVSNPHSSLLAVSRTVPQILKRRYVLEQCCTKQIPIFKAVWLIRCSFSMEWKIMMTKHKAQSSDQVCAKLYKEWTGSIVHILERLVFEMTQYSGDASQLKAWKKRSSYFLKLLGNCYTLQLLDRNIFHHWLAELLGKVENFECLPLTLHIASIFWDGICQTTESNSTSEGLFLVSKVTKALLHKYYLISRSRSMLNDEQYLINDVKKNAKIESALLKKMKSMILQIFHEQSMEAFIMPNSNWDLYKPCLYEILNIDKVRNLEGDWGNEHKKLELIVFRNDSLKFDGIPDNSFGTPEPVRNSFEGINGLFVTNFHLKLKKVDCELTDLLDFNSPCDDWLFYAENKLNRIGQIVQMILWAVHPSRRSHYEASYLVAKIMLLKMNSQDSFQEHNIEDIVWALIFRFARIPQDEFQTHVNINKLHQILNILIGYGLIKVPTYIRKIISSGILYLASSEDKFFHCRLLINLKISPLMRSQYNMVLKNVMEYDSTYFEQNNYEELLIMLESAKDSLLSNEYDFVKIVPFSVKFMCSEWYLNLICSPGDDMLPQIEKEDILEKYNIFCDKLKEFNHFYKWVEFITYHQLLTDLESLECLADILMNHERLFSLLINDQILMMKTLIHLYTKSMATQESNFPQLYEFSPLWKFFTKKFQYALDMDPDLHICLTEVCEGEKAAIEQLKKSQDLTIKLYASLRQDSCLLNSDNTHFSFASIFQQNLKSIFNTKDRSSLVLAKRSLRLLFLANPNDYKKFMSVYLKRRNFKLSDLIFLISAKLMSFELINNVLGEQYLTKLLKDGDGAISVSYQLLKTKFINHNFKFVLKLCSGPSTFDFELFDYLVLKHNCSISKRRQISYTFYQLMSNLMEPEREAYLEKSMTGFVHHSNQERPKSLSLAQSGADDRVHDDKENILWLYSLLDFTNKWIFQILSKYLFQKLLVEDEREAKIRTLILEILRISDYNNLCAKLFDDLTDAELVRLLLSAIEGDFLQKCMKSDKISMNYYFIVLEIVTSFSKTFARLHFDSSYFNYENLELFTQCARYFINMSSAELKENEIKLDVYLKLIIVQQQNVFKELVEELNRSESELIERLCALFEKIDFNLKIKLLLYDILSSMRSFMIYASTSRGPQDTKENLLKSKIPDCLLNLPPFKISLFMKRSSELSDSQDLLGLQTFSTSVKMVSDHEYFMFNNETEEFDCPLTLSPFHCLVNYQEDRSADFNNTPLSMSLFGARFDKKNPT
ncbi:LAMI_0A00914g1_1 [Lachancea mirantina]|uniref:Mediator of RNA polymerase II transcription subunit 12 n=1 Tax=Lachancea mirantina TaxID=1230905 RepID=A0A1G4ILC4_9SACH|nr:LAMI_0A00914g1_1 [Lachancea mirantina]